MKNRWLGGCGRSPERTMLKGTFPHNREKYREKSKKGLSGSALVAGNAVFPVISAPFANNQ
jgi:hypothetical protein